MAATQPTGSVTIALAVSQDRDGITGEPVGNGYARQATTLSAGSITAEGRATNHTAATFGPFSADIGTMRAAAIFVGATLVWRGPLTTPLVLSNGQTVSIDANSLGVTVGSA